MEIIKADIKWDRPLIPLHLDQVDSIALHHMDHATAGIEEIHRWHLAQGWAGFGYNYWIDKQGNIYEGRGLNQAAGVLGHNSHIISVGFQGDYDQVDKFMPEVQFNSGVWLVRKLMRDIPSVRIVHGHKHWNNTSCPGRYFPLIKMVEGIFAEEYPPHWVEKYWQYLNGNGVKIYEKRYDDPATRGEVFALLARMRGMKE